MTYEGEIFRISTPLVCGTAMAALIAEKMGSICCYAGTAVLMPLITVILATVYINPDRSPAFRNIFFWSGMIFLCGILCFFQNAITSQGTVHIRLIGHLSSGLSGIIGDIPFSDKEDNALIKALLTGDRQSLTTETVSDFRKAGAAHLLALSGMHLGIIYLAVNRILRLTGNSPVMRKARSIAVIIVTGFYTLMCGAGPSLSRAWLFILLNESAKIMERPQPPQQIFCSALSVHLLINPLSITTIGFQLSYLAMAGIIFVWPRVRDWLDSAIWRMASLSISCQLFTAPLTLFYFGTFPKYFLITNLVCAPLMTVVMAAGIIATAAQAAGVTALWLYTVCEAPVAAMRWIMGNIAEV